MFQTHHSVRTLLRGLRHPQSLERDELALVVKRAYDLPSAKEAITTLVRSALASYDPILHKIVEGCDVDGESTKRVAGRLGLSMRQFFRYRSRAMEAIAIALEELLEPVEPTSVLMRMTLEFDARLALEIHGTSRRLLSVREGLEVLAGRDAAGERLALSAAEQLPRELRGTASIIVAQSAEHHGDVEEAEHIVAQIAASLADEGTRFELAGLACQQAIRRCDFEALAAWCRQSRAAVCGDAGRAVVADLRVAEAVLRCGTLAEEFGDPLEGVLRRLPPRVSVARTAARLQGYRAFLEGDFSSAYECARTASLAGFAPFDTVDAQILAARAAYLLGMREPDAAIEPRSDWQAAMAASIEARFALRRRDRAQARKLATRAVRQAQRAGAPAALAYAYASLGAVASSEGGIAEAQMAFDEARRLCGSDTDDTVQCDVFAIAGIEDAEVHRTRRFRSGRLDIATTVRTSLGA